MNELNEKFCEPITKDFMINAIRDAINFLPTTYISDKDKIMVECFFEEMVNKIDYLESLGGED